MRARTAVMAVLVSLSCAPAASAAAPAPAPGTLAVAGHGSVMVRPDLATVSLTVTRAAPRPAPALSSVDRHVEEILAAVHRLGVPSSSVQTTSIASGCRMIRVGPRRHRRRIRRCTASEALSIVSTTSLAGRVIDAATRGGASRIDGPSFSFSDPSAGEVAAERAAVADAQQQARAAAAQLGDVLTGVQSVSLNPDSLPTATAGSSAASSGHAPAAPTRVRPGAQEVDATVAVVFTIAAAG